MSTSKVNPKLRLPSIALAALLACVLLAAGCAQPEAEAPAGETTPAAGLDLPPGADDAAATIDEAYLRQAIAYLASDELEGRAPGTAGDVAARRYVAEQLAAAGVEPGGPDGGWEQPFPIVSLTAEVPETWAFQHDGERLELRWWDDFIAASGVQREKASIDGAELVFVGYGIEAPEYGWDDYKGADLNGKVLVMLNNDPDWDDELFAGTRRLYYGRWTYKYESAARQGAVGAIIIHTDESAGYGWNVVQSSWSGPQFELPAGDEPRLEIPAWATYEATERLWQLAGRDLAADLEAAKTTDFKPIPLGVRTSLALDVEVNRDVETANVLGLIRGGDSELADEVVVYTAHHDHLGRGKPDASGDDIYNGALDNASGVAQVLAIARAFKALEQPPRRSVLFLLVAAEEQGLLGSKYYAAHPTFPPGKIAANVNFDAGGIWGRTADLVYIGYGKSSLDAVVEAAAAKQGRHVVGDQFPDKGFFYRSDQFSLAKIGVPAIYLDGGTELIGQPPGKAREMIEEWTRTHYHQPSDELTDDWNFDGLIADAQIGFYCGLAIANAEQMPAWNPGDEFEAARLEAIAAAGG
ncbi:MAG: M28 family peptidase [Acidobacteria bacterium]|nr:MAG: M28 family peptidase [Acidobacteriota bacterium]